MAAELGARLILGVAFIFLMLTALWITARIWESGPLGKVLVILAVILSAVLFLLWVS